MIYWIEELKKDYTVMCAACLELAIKHVLVPVYDNKEKIQKLFHKNLHLTELYIIELQLKVYY